MWDQKWTTLCRTEIWEVTVVDVSTKRRTWVIGTSTKVEGSGYVSPGDVPETRTTRRRTLPEEEEGPEVSHRGTLSQGRILSGRVSPEDLDVRFLRDSEGGVVS